MESINRTRGKKLNYKNILHAIKLGFESDLAYKIVAIKMPSTKKINDLKISGKDNQ